MPREPMFSLGRPVLLLAWLVTVPFPAFAGSNLWTSGGPFGGDVMALAIDPSAPRILYAATARGGVFRSTDGGGSWQAVNSGLDVRAAASLVIDPAAPSTLYVGMQDGGGVFRSDDRGGSWRRASDGLPGVDSFVDVMALLIDPTAPATLYAGTGGAGIFKTADGGGSWQEVNIGLGSLRVRGLAVDPSRTTRIHAATGDGVWKSEDGGATWVRSGAELSAESVVQIVVDPAVPSTIYAVSLGIFDSELWKSTDGGASWSELVFPNAFVSRLAIDPRDSDVLYAASNSNSNVFRSSDGGASWSGGSEGIPSGVLTAIVLDPRRPEIVYVGSLTGASGVFKSTDRAVHFEAAVQGFTATAIPHIAVDPLLTSTLYAASQAGLWRSVDRGEAWTLLDLGFVISRSIGDVVTDPADPGTVYAAGGGGFGAFGRGFFKSPDRGETWEIVNNDFGDDGLISVSDLEIDPQTSTTFVAVSGRGLVRSTDGGVTWSSIEAGLPSRFVADVAFAASRPSALYVSTVSTSGSGRVSKSTDGGATWTRADSGLPGDFILSLTADPRVPDTVYAAGVGGVFKTTDGGAQWRPAGAVPFDVAIDLAVDPNNSSNLYASTFAGVLRSADGGDRWTPFGDVPASLVVDLVVDPMDSRILHGGTDGGGVVDIEHVEAGCVASDTVLCIDDRPGDARFAVRIFHETELGVGSSGDAEAVPLADLGIARGGIFSFFDPKNPEVLVKVLDGCSINDHFWVFYAATTTVGFTLTVTDTLTGQEKAFSNPDLTTAVPVTDIQAFNTCVDGGGSAGHGSAVSAAGLPAAAPVQDLPGTTGQGASCVGDATTLCIEDAPGDPRFRVTADFATELGGGSAGSAQAVSLVPLGIARGGVFSFFDPSNPEILVKVLDGCDINGHFWVFSAATTTVGFTLTVEDTRAGVTRIIENPDMTPAAPIADTTAFATCE